MATNWKNKLEEYKRTTFEKAENDILKLTRLTEDEISVMHRDGINIESLTEVLAVVNDAAQENSVKAENISNINKGIETLIVLVKKLL